MVPCSLTSSFLGHLNNPNPTASPRSLTEVNIVSVAKLGTLADDIYRLLLSSAHLRRLLVLPNAFWSRCLSVHPG